MGGGGKKKDERQNCLIGLLNRPGHKGGDIKDGPEACAGHLLTEQITDAATDRTSRASSDYT